MVKTFPEKQKVSLFKGEKSELSKPIWISIFYPFLMLSTLFLVPFSLKTSEGAPLLAPPAESILEWRGPKKSQINVTPSSTNTLKKKRRKESPDIPRDPSRKIPGKRENTGLPLDRYRRIDWLQTAREGLIFPLEDLLEEFFEDEFNKNEIDTDPVYHNSMHIYWLSCENCHPKFFPMERGGTKDMTMKAIFKGEFCGKCHGTVAFSLGYCMRCHFYEEV
ncbi:MAG: c(7)-type cytochrome triheme domain-containing protein, partial [Nitrospinota bacterium]